MNMPDVARRLRRVAALDHALGPSSERRLALVEHAVRKQAPQSILGFDARLPPQERKGEGPSPEPRHALPQVEEAQVAAVVRVALFNDVRAPMAHPRNEVGGLLLPERSPEDPY